MSESKDFLRVKVEEDLKKGKYSEIITRFPPEPNGFPHIFWNCTRLSRTL